MRDPETNLERSLASNVGDQRLRVALGEILGAVPDTPKEDFLHLCQFWLDLVGAKWVWFWMSHRDREGEQKWEILTVCAADGNHDDYAPVRLDSTSRDRAVVNYTSEVGRPLFVDDVQGWGRKRDGHHYRVIRWKEIEKNGAQSFLSVPLIFSSQTATLTRPAPYSVLDLMSGAMCFHFANKKPAKPLFSEEEYLLLAKATVSAICHSFATAQQRILNKLDALSGKYLTMPGMMPEVRRSKYLEDVTKLIQSELHVNYVSFFYEVEDGQEIECIATTGIERDGQPLPMNQLGMARYQKGQQITGEVFASGVPFVWNDGSAMPRRDPTGGIWRETPCPNPGDERFWVAWPIRTPLDEGAESSDVRILGVIRCVDNHAIHNGRDARPFDPVQLQTLEFITAQLAPILDVMAAGIRRDRTVNIVKHDLYAPLRVIEDQVDQLEGYFSNHGQSVEYLPSNIRAAVVLAKNLAGSLSEQVAFMPEPTLLEGDIVARLRDGLGRFAWVENRMTIRYEGLREIPPLKLDRSLIERAICNLLINAIKYGTSNTEIRVVGEARREAYVVRIENFGIGIKPDEERRVFEGTYRTPDAIARKLGLGLGLKIARSAMRRHEGSDLLLIQGNKPTIFALVFSKNLATP